MTAASYDAVAAAYAASLGDELRAKPLDRALLAAFGELAGPGPIADLGSGPAHLTRRLGRRAVALDLSPEMARVARYHPFVTGSMLSLPFRDGVLAGVLACYSIIHFDRPGRRRAFAEMARVLRPGGVALIAFHVDAAEAAAGTSLHLTEHFGAVVDLTFHFLDPASVTADLEAAGLPVTATTVREPIPGAEFPSRRAYLLAAAGG
ncbi:class I SAM-dependent methyltransferase [Actinoplanes sp. RD1]|uniref:class I SAM-dependent methyltransferase n=1 Tax=Actinoplanes sp. RD1 TaxID=3064538 RepID=UPI002741CE0C|nr:methyltransferase domain-containing protein [Actinoplanes sp. RD1]